MNVIGLCQGANLKVFAELVRLTADEISYDKLGIFVADAGYFCQSQEAQRLEDNFSVQWLKEWQSVGAGLARQPDQGVLDRFENELGAPSLWAGILADRRLIFGRYCKTIQDYRPRYSEAQLLGILTEALLRVEQLFNEVNPHLVFGFVPVTLHEYLILRFAQTRGIPIRLLRSTKIENYVSLNDSLFGLSDHIRQTMNKPISADAAATVQVYLAKTRERGAVYEGMHLPSHASRRFRPRSAARAIAGALKHEIRRQKVAEIKNDTHNPGYFLPALIEQIRQPLRAAKARRLIAKSGGGVWEVTGERYCLFPLHFEPEIALQIYARPLQNQIEAARTIALALPAGMKLVVKEHPRAAGFRPAGYYKKLLEIPNVVLAEAGRSSYELVRSASVVVVITGNIGLEAAVLGKPVVVLGQTDYSVLPAHMLRTCHNLYDLSAEIRTLLTEYRADEDALRQFLGAVVASSVPVDLYSVLLGKGGRHGFSAASFEDDVAKLKAYVIERFRTAGAKGE